MKIKKINAIKEIIDPAEDNAFQSEYESGKSEYRRGIPANPKKCCGKKVKFTPINIIKKCALAHRWCSAIPVNSGYQYVKAAKIPNTAPILRT